uniref:Nonstructural protein 1 n=1 Tax=Otus scops parvoviridae sp. TaxID=2794520 RepID=A0A8A4XE30_9VIRU|nr:MAG: nonstructural protein 1 [Otus scops parvoviridae sp.]
MSVHSVASEDSLIKDVTQRDIRSYLEGVVPVSPSSTGMLATGAPYDTGGLSTTRGRPTSMAAIAEVSREGFDNLAKKTEEMGSNFFNYVTGKDIKNSWRYLSDVILFDNFDKRDRIVQILCGYGRTRRNGMFGFSVEDDHIHIIHDCCYAGNHCRCIWRKQVEPLGQFGAARTENKPIWKFTRTDWYDVFIYFFLRKRGTREIWTRGTGWKTPTDGK